MDIEKNCMKDLCLKEILQPGAHVLVVGLGKSGISAVKFLLGLGLQVSVSEGGRAAQLDGETVQWLQEKGVAMEISGHTSEFFLKADAVLPSPGIPLDLPALTAARNAGIPILGEMALAPAYLKTPVVAVTGTNGKSTVTELIGEICKAAGKKVFVGGNIGIPLTDYLAGPQDAEVVVLEVSSFQLDSAGKFRPDVAVLLNISPDHLDRYESYDAYAASKMSIMKNQLPGDIAVCNGDDREIRNRLQGASYRSRVVLFSGQQAVGTGAYVQDDLIVTPGPEGQENVSDCYSLIGTGLRGNPNGLNALAAILASRAMGCGRQAVEMALKRFTLLPHRLSLVAEQDGVRFYDDSKATNEGAAASALAGFDCPVILIAGGRDKGGDYSVLAAAVPGKVKAMILLGEASAKMAEVFRNLTAVEQVGDMAEAVQRAIARADRGDVVLLSPACASFDMFKSYAHRGDVFRQAVLDAVAQGAGACQVRGRRECRACIA